jgi:hypothetical protein
MKWFKKVFNAKPAEEELKFQLSLGKYVWHNKQEKIDKLTIEVQTLNKRIESLLGQLKHERALNIKLLSKGRENGKSNRGDTRGVGIRS